MPFAGYAGWVLTLDPSAVADDRVELALNDPDNSGLSVGASGSDSGGVNWGTAELTQFMSQQGQWGNAPSDYIVPNRTITVPIGLGMSLSPDAPDPETALRNLSMKVALIQREGGWLLRQRQNLDGTTGDPLYADVVDAQLEVPDDWLETAGVEPGVTLTLTCLPDFYGDEIQLDTIHCTGYCDAVLTLNGEPAVIEGDYPARCRIKVSANSIDADQNSAFWGIRSRYYAAGNSYKLSYLASELFAAPGTSTPSLTDCYSATGIESPSLSSSWPTTDPNIASFQPSSVIPKHTGTYNIWARMKGTVANIQAALTWQPADITPPVPGTPNTTTNTAMVLPSSGFGIVNLGAVTLPLLPSGLQYPASWMGTINAMSPSGSGNAILDCLWLQPLAESAGNAQITVSGPNLIPQVSLSTEFRTEGIYSMGLGSVGVGYWIVPFLGNLPRLPSSGMEGRPVELLMKPSRAAFGSVDPNIDDLIVTPYYRPTYLSRI